SLLLTVAAPPRSLTSSPTRRSSDLRSVLNPDEKAAVDRLLGEGNGNGNGKGAVSLDVAACPLAFLKALLDEARLTPNQRAVVARSEEHTSELQSLAYLVCRPLLEKK